MSRRCGSSKHTPTPLNGKVTRPTGDPKKKERKECLVVGDRNKSSTKAIAIPPARGVGRASVYGRAPVGTDVC